MLTLLRRSNNDECSTIPPWRMPTVRKLAAEVGVGERRMRRLIAHLVAHGWLEYVPGPGRQYAKKTGQARCVFRPVPGYPQKCRPPCEGIHPNAHKDRTPKRVPGPALDETERVGGPALEGVPVKEFPQVDTAFRPRDDAARGVVEGKAPEPLTVTIAGRVHRAEVCKGCTELVPIAFAYDHFHMYCHPVQPSRAVKEPAA